MAQFKVGEYVTSKERPYLGKGRIIDEVDFNQYLVKFGGGAQDLFEGSDLVAANACAKNGKFKVNDAVTVWRGKYKGREGRILGIYPTGTGKQLVDMLGHEGRTVVDIEDLSKGFKDGTNSCAKNACAKNYAWSTDPIKLMIQYAKREDYGGIMDFTRPEEAESMGLYPADVVRSVYAKASKYYAGGRNMATPAQQQELVGLLSQLKYKAANACAKNTKFKVGDRVRHLTKYEDLHGTIIDIRDAVDKSGKRYVVRFDKGVRGAFGKPSGLYGDNELSLANSSCGIRSTNAAVNAALNRCAKNAAFKLGDKVRIAGSVMQPSFGKEGRIVKIDNEWGDITIKADDGKTYTAEESVVGKISNALNACARNAFTATPGDVNRMCNEGLQAGKKLLQHVNEWMGAIRDYQRNPNLQDKYAQDEYETTQGLVEGLKDALRAMGW